MESIDVQLVGRATNADFFLSEFPRALREATSIPEVNFKIGLYDSDAIEVRKEVSGISISLRGLRKHENQGFGHNHNELFFGTPQSPEAFILLNPDCLPAPGSIDLLVETFESSFYRSRGIPAIVEGRQWPYEHPKEYNPKNGQTPWASGAFSLISSEFFRTVNGFDSNFFLYLEDVDLSWMAWREGWQVLYQPAAVGWHWTEFPHYKAEELNIELMFSFQNFPKLAYKHFGPKGLRVARKMMRRYFPKAAVSSSLLRAMATMSPLSGPTRHNQVKIIDFNLFHKVR